MTLGLQLEPTTKVVFNAPFLNKQNATVRITNNEKWPVMYRIRCTSPRRFLLERWFGALEVGDSVLIVIALLPLTFREGMHDCFTIEYCRIPGDHGVFFEDEFMKKSDVILQRQLPVDFHL